MPTTIPTTTSTTRPGSPSTGDAYFETDTNNYIIYDGANWRSYEADSQTLPAITNTYSLSFDGSNDYLDTGSKYDFVQQTCDFSIVCWVKFTNYTSTSANQAILATNYTGAQKGFYLFYDNRSNNKTLRTLFRAGSSSDISVNNAVSDNDWFHVAVTCAAGGTQKLYVDGSVIGSTAAPTTTTDSAYHNMTLGVALVSAVTPTYFFGGNLDEVAVFNRELSGTQIDEIYNSGTPNDIDSLNPRSWWRMGDSNSGTGNVTDDGFLGNTATVNGATYVSGAGNTPS